MADPLKTPRHQAQEIQKLLLDAQERIDLALRGLQNLQDRLSDGVKTPDSD